MRWMQLWIVWSDQVCMVRCLVALGFCRDSVEWSEDLQQSAVQSVRENSAEQLVQEVAGETVRL